ncbi:MAG: gliding motility-associated C-terminal domain-containing protein, partial [Bacteroidia bacterium]|nr:gliding motility-associated C-terminal domain-containing protein [Bacteroidia bacterium]
DITEPSCFGEDNGMIELTGVNNVSPPSQLSFEGAFTTLNQFGGLSSGEYLLSVTDRFGCSHSEGIGIMDPPQFVVELGPDLEVDLGESVIIIPTSNQEIGSYLWISPDTICKQGCESLEFIPNNSGQVLYSANSFESNCPSMDSLFINVNKVRKVFFPNIINISDQFEPNNSFAIFGSKPNVRNIESLKIFDRWGNLVFENNQLEINDPESGWNGLINNQLAEQGVYVFQAVIRFLDDELIDYSGSFLLLR